MSERASSREEPSPFERFKTAMKQIVSVPKAEIDRREKAWREERQRINAQRKREARR